MVLQNTKKMAVACRDYLKSLSKKQIVERGAVAAMLLGLLYIATLVTPYVAPTPQQYFYADERASNDVTYFRASVVDSKDGEVTARLLDGPQEGSTVPVENISQILKRYLRTGDHVVVVQGQQGVNMTVVEFLRIPGLIVLAVIFMALVLFIGRRRGVGSLIGLAVSILVLGWGIVPLIVSGYNALWVSIAGAYVIAFASIFIAHGFRRRTVISVGAIAIILAVVIMLAMFAAGITHLTGIEGESGLYLSIGMESLDMRGLFVGGVIIATLGVLDDIVTAQVAVVDELRSANPRFSVKELYQRAMSVGGEHIASLVNTLALAYAGASLPVIIQLVVSSQNSTFMLFNSEFIAAEIVRTLVASIGLVLAVPISTAIAAYIFSRKQKQRT